MTRMARHASGYDLRAVARTRQWQFFTLALPVLFLVIFASVFGGSRNTTPVAARSPRRCTTCPASSPWE